MLPSGPTFGPNGMKARGIWTNLNLSVPSGLVAVMFASSPVTIVPSGRIDRPFGPAPLKIHLSPPFWVRAYRWPSTSTEYTDPSGPTAGRVMEYIPVCSNRHTRRPNEDRAFTWMVMVSLEPPEVTTWTVAEPIGGASG